MSEWQKKEKAVENTPDSTGKSHSYNELAGTGLTPHKSRKRRSDAGKKQEPAVKKERTPEPSEQIAFVPSDRNYSQDADDNPPQIAPSPLRYTAGGRRRGRYRFAAPLGLLVLILSVVGLVSLVGMGINAYKRSQDNTPLRNEMNDFLSPVMQYKPEAFTDINESKQDALLLAAIWRVTDAENIREEKEKTTISNYQTDDLGRMLIPISEIEQSYSYLFGPDAVPYHHTIGDEGQSFTIEYDKDQGYYHVPFISSSSIYVPVIDTVKQKGDTVTVRVGYVLTTKIGVDDKGKNIDPTPDMADIFQNYTVKRSGTEGWKLVSVADEKTTASASTTKSNSETTQAVGNASFQGSTSPAQATVSANTVASGT